jgi:dihydroxyacetone kinase phosphotransfer subunit
VIGIVVVSHSPLLARAAVDLALEMVSGQQPAIAIAAGAADGVTGTDAVKVSEAITEVSSPDGVLVMMDLGSAVLSAELALELLPDSWFEVRLTSAPFVEGLLAGVVRAAGGASLDEVEREARGALAAKRGQLGEDEQSKAPESPAHTPGQRHATAQPEAAAEVPVVNPAGLHARPAAMLIDAISPLDARVMIANRRTGRQPLHANGPTALLTLAARQGDVLEVTATGNHAVEAVSAVRDLVEAGFGELNSHRADG